MPDVNQLTEDTVRHTLTSDRSAPAVARQAVREAAVGLPRDLVERAELAISEIVTNSVRHGTDPASAIDLVVERGSGRLMVWVRDGGRSSAPANSDVGGFGLAIVASVADEFAIDEGDGWTVRVAFTSRVVGRRRDDS